MISSPNQYRLSSYNANGAGKEIELCTPHEVYTRLGKSKSTQLERESIVNCLNIIWTTTSCYKSGKL